MNSKMTLCLRWNLNLTSSSHQLKAHSIKTNAPFVANMCLSVIYERMMVSPFVSRAQVSRNQGRMPEEDTVEGQQYGYKYYTTVGCDLCLCDSFCILDVWPGRGLGLLPAVDPSCLPGIALYFNVPGVEPDNIGVCGLYFLP